MSPRRKSRIARLVLRRGGLIASIIFAVVYFASGVYATDIAITRNERIGLAGGLCFVTWRTVSNPDIRTWATGAGIYFNKFANGEWQSSFTYSKNPESSYIYFPLWLPATVAVACTIAGFLWRESKQGLCHRCGYARQGILGDVPCPECGTAPRSVA